MNKKNTDKFLYFQLIGILLIPLCLIISYSYTEREIGTKDFVLQKAAIPSVVNRKALKNLSELPAEETPLSILPAAPEIITDTTSQRILLIGDSMVEGLNKRLRYYAAENEHEVLSVIWYSSSTKVWAECDTLNHFIKQFSPSYILICLGGNELFVRDLDKREGYIQKILSKIDTIPYIWIGPPNWKEDTGINDLIEKNAGSHRYFPSKNLFYDRASDGAHPTMNSAAKWMDSVAIWIDTAAHYRIRMNFPEKNRKPIGKTELLMPLN